MNGLSKRWTAWSLYREAFTDLGWIEMSELHIMGLAIVNRAVEDVLSQIFPAVFNLYLTSDIIVAASAGNRSVSGTGAWVASSKRLVFGAMASPFAETDIGKLVAFVISGNCYVGVISSWVSITTVGLDGAFLPAANGTVDSVIVVSTRISSLVADISSLSISNFEGARIVLESSAIDEPCEALSVDDFKKFRPTGLSNKGKIVYARQGNTLLLRMGSEISTLGTLTLYYPRLSYVATADGDYVDLPDGGGTRLGLLRVKAILAERLDRQVNLQAEISQALKEVYDVAKLTLSEEENRKKVAALT